MRSDDPDSLFGLTAFFWPQPLEKTSTPRRQHLVAFIVAWNDTESADTGHGKEDVSHPRTCSSSKPLTTGECWPVASLIG